VSQDPDLGIALVAVRNALTSESVEAVTAHRWGAPFRRGIDAVGARERQREFRREIPVTLHDPLIARLHRLGGTQRVAVAIWCSFPLEESLGHDSELACWASLRTCRTKRRMKSERVDEARRRMAELERQIKHLKSEADQIDETAIERGVRSAVERKRLRVVAEI